MQQLKMLKIKKEIAACPLHEDYFFRNIDESDPADIEAWVQICRFGLLGEDATTEAYTAAITNTPGLIPEKDVFLVIEKATGRAVATLTAHILESGQGNIHMVAAREDVRGKGISHAMLAKGLKRLAEDGVYRTGLNTDDFRRPAIRAYLKAGFQPLIYDTDMVDRWTVILNEMGWEERDFIVQE